MFETFFFLLVRATGETLYMSLVSAVIGAVLGIPLAVILYTTRPGRFLANRWIHYGLGTVINIGRSIPFIILILYIIPLTRLIVGTFIGNTAAIVPLTVAAIPFIARMVETVLNEVPNGLIEAAQAMGARPSQIIGKVLLAEAIPGIINVMTITLIALIGYSAMAGAVGAGGLGKVAISYGYQRYNYQVMNYTVIILVLLVQGVQSLGDFLGKRCNHRN